MIPLPRTMAGRAALVLLLGVVASQLIGLTLYAGDRKTLWSDARAQYAAERIVGIVRQMESLDSEARRQAAPRLGSPRLWLAWTENKPLAGEKSDAGKRFRRLILKEMGDIPAKRVKVGYGESLPEAWAELVDSAFGRMRRAPHMMPGAGSVGFLTVSVRMEEGDWLNFAAPTSLPEPFWASGWFFSILLTTLVVVGISLWAVRRATRPLDMLAVAAERLGRDMGAPPVPEEGPVEVKKAASAFNGMQKRLSSFVEDRTRMLAAISHDLRTPITRLRLRAEFMEDAEQKAKALADLEEMEAMIASTLSFARDDPAREAAEEFDLAAMIRQLTADMGATFSGPEELVFQGRPRGLKRALANLIDNALKFGHAARVHLARTEDAMEITVEDDGPGIPEPDLETVFAPFRRVEGSRSRETGGVGLGLSVVRQVALAHGGKASLTNRPEGGLRATLHLPL